MNYPVSLKCTRKAKEVCDSVSPKKNTVFHSPTGCGSLEDKQAPLLFSSEISSCFQGVSVSVLNSHLVKCLGSKSRKSSHTYWCMYDTVFWIHMLFCIKNKLLQDYEYIYPTIFPSLSPVTLLIFECIYTMIFIFFCCSNLCILGLLHEKERKRTSSFSAIELNERSDTCLTYFPYPCKSNFAAPLSWETESYSLIYTDGKRSQIFAHFNWFWADRNWSILHNSKLLKTNLFFIKNGKGKWY